MAKTNSVPIQNHVLVIKVTLTRMKNWHNIMVAYVCFLLMDALD